jgi:hypothetical protein
VDHKLSSLNGKMHSACVPPPSCCSTFYLRLYSPCGPCTLFLFLNLYTVDRTPWTGDQPVARPLRMHRTTQTQNKRTQMSMPRVGFEPTVLVLEWAKTVHSFGRAATVIGLLYILQKLNALTNAAYSSKMRDNANFQNPDSKWNNE